VDVRLYTIIYKAIEDMEKAMKGLLAPEYREVLLGHAEVRNVFKITGAGIIAGCYVQDGKLLRNNLKKANKDENWVKRVLAQYGTVQEDVFLLTVDAGDHIYFCKRE
jgi:translation initiation factor IF-2